MTHGFCDIGIYQGKHPANLGTLWRTAFQLGANGIFVIGRRYRHQGSDTCKSFRHIPLRQYDTIDHWKAALPYAAMIVGIEIGGEPLETFAHPRQAVYLLGAEDHGLPPVVQACCHRIVSLSAVRVPSYNVAVAGSLVLYHRHIQRGNHANPA